MGKKVRIWFSPLLFPPHSHLNRNQSRNPNAERRKSNHPWKRIQFCNFELYLSVAVTHLQIIANSERRERSAHFHAYLSLALFVSLHHNFLSGASFLLTARKSSETRPRSKLPLPPAIGFLLSPLTGPTPTWPPNRRRRPSWAPGAKTVEKGRNCLGTRPRPWPRSSLRTHAKP